VAVVFIGFYGWRSGYESARYECAGIVEQTSRVYEYGVDWRWRPAGYVCQYRDGQFIEHELGLIP
jgi:hypothetical protein